MRFALPSVRANVAGAVALALLPACGGLAHPTSNDGLDGPGESVGTPSVSYSISNQAPKVGETVNVSVFANGQPVATNTGSNVTSSDQSVLVGTAGFYRAVSVGSSTIGISYGTYNTTQKITVLPSADGMSAYVYNQSTVVSGPSFSPPSVSVKAGASIEFKFTDGTHNLVFDVVPGAPADVESSAANLNPTRQFSSFGTFSYRCTIHGETGNVTVVP